MFKEAVCLYACFFTQLHEKVNTSSVILKCEAMLKNLNHFETVNKL